MLVLVTLRLFLPQYLVWCIKNNIHCIISKTIIYLQNTLHKYDRKDVEKILKGNGVFNRANVSTKILLIINIMDGCIYYTYLTTK